MHAPPPPEAELGVAFSVHPGRFTVTSWRAPYQPPATVDGVEQESPVGETELHLLWADLQQGQVDIAAQVALAEAHGGDSAELSYMRGVVHLRREELAAAMRNLAAAVDGRPGDRATGRGALSADARPRAGRRATARRNPECGH
jgi:hypothetical protein